jgi:DNA processing protein
MPETLDFPCKDSTLDAIYLRALAEVEGVGCRTLVRLLRELGNPRALWEAPESFLEFRLSQQKREAFLRHRERGLHTEWLEVCQKLNIQVVSLTDPAYPALLKEITDPPLLLYVKGNMRALQSKTLAVVGTRHISEYGRQVTESLIQGLTQSRVVIISGLAQGVDTTAHWAAVKNDLPTVAVFGCGLDKVYPTSNRPLCQEIIAQGGALISEYPLGTPATRFTFPQRNRIVAGVSYGVLVVEGDIKSGSLITARLAMEEGRSVMAVPGNIFSVGSQGPLSLIQQGAAPVCSGEDILKELNWWTKESAELQADQRCLDGKFAGGRMDRSTISHPCLLTSIPEFLSESERSVLQAISFDATGIEELRQTTGLSSAKINECLTLLELEGLIVLLPGAKVCRR